MRFAHPILLYLTPLFVGALWLGLALARRRQARLVATFAGGTGRAWAKPNFSTSRRRLDLLLTLLGQISSSIPISHRQRSVMM